MVGRPVASPLLSDDPGAVLVHIAHGTQHGVGEPLDRVGMQSRHRAEPNESEAVLCHVLSVGETKVARPAGRAAEATGWVHSAEWSANPGSPTARANRLPVPVRL